MLIFANQSKYVKREKLRDVIHVCVYVFLCIHTCVCISPVDVQVS